MKPRNPSLRYEHVLSLKENKWAYIHMGGLKQGRWRDPETGRLHSTEQALSIQTGRIKDELATANR